MEVLAVSKTTEWATIQRLLIERMQYYNGEYLRTEDKKHRGAYYGIFEFLKFVGLLAANGEQLIADRKQREEEGDEG